MKTDPRPYQFVSVGPAILTLAPDFSGLNVLNITGGQVTRSGAALVGGDTLATGDVLSITPTSAGGTVTLSCEQADQEFSGRFADLDGLTLDTVSNPPRLVYTNPSRAQFAAQFTALPLPVEDDTLGSWALNADQPADGTKRLWTIDLPSGSRNTGGRNPLYATGGAITGLSAATTYTDYSPSGVLYLNPYEFTYYSTGTPPDYSLRLFLMLPADVTPPGGLHFVISLPW